MKNSNNIPNKIINLTDAKKKKDQSFSMAVHSELMIELIAGEIDPKAVYNLLTEKGKIAVAQRMCV